MREQMQTAPRRYDFRACLEASEKIDWTVEDLIGEDKQLDFDRPFLPESLARVEGLEFLTTAERRTLNQIRGHGYLYTFGLVEEFILPFVLDHAREGLANDDYRTRSFLAFAAEEAKHIHLFKRFREEFVKGFGVECEVIGPPQAISEHVLSHHRLAVALLILHIEWMTQRHFVDSVKDDTGIDPQFASLLRHHWMEEAQHAKLDTLMVHEMAATMTEEDIVQGIDGYLDLGGFLDAGLEQQAKFDLAALEKAEQLRLSDLQRDRILKAQHQALRWTFIGTGITHPEFLRTVGELSGGGRQKLEMVAPVFS